MNAVKTLASQAAAIVLAAGLTGCGILRQTRPSTGDQPPPKNNCTDDSTEWPRAAVSALERCALRIDDNELPCRTAVVTLYSEGFSIRCDTDHRFQHYPNADILVWNSGTFYDENRDGIVDYIDIYDLGRLKPGEEHIKLYKERLEKLNKNYIQALWEQRWQPPY